MLHKLACQSSLKNFPKFHKSAVASPAALMDTIAYIFKKWHQKLLKIIMLFLLKKKTLQTAMQCKSFAHI